jgi:hypothetical protein
MWNMRPWVARQYLTEVAKQFEQYAAEHYVPALGAANATGALRLAGLRFVETRKIPGHEATIREIITTRIPGLLGRQIDAAALDALLATMEDPVATARFLAEVATLDKELPNSKLAAHGLERMGPPAAAGLLAELAEATGPSRRLKIARLLARVSGVSSPEPILFWKRAPDDKRASALERWRAELDAAGLLPPPPEPQDGHEPAEDADWTDDLLFPPPG